MTTESTQVHNGITLTTKKPLKPMAGVATQKPAIMFPEKTLQSGVQHNKPFTLYTTDDLVKLDPEGVGYANVRYFLETARLPIDVIVVPHDVDAAKVKIALVGGTDDSGQKFGIPAFELCNFAPTNVAVIGATGIEIANQLRSYCDDALSEGWTDCTNTNTQAAFDYADTLNIEKVWCVDVNGERYSHAISPAVIGMAARCSVNPWETPNGIKTPLDFVARPVGYRVTGKTCEAVQLNKKGISVIVQDPEGGFMFLGTRTTSGAFGNIVGIENQLLRAIAKAHRETMSKNLNLEFFKMKVAQIDNWATKLVADDAVIGMRVYLHPERNNVASYENGEWVLVIEWGAYRPNEHSIVELNQDSEIVKNFVETAVATFKG